MLAGAQRRDGEGRVLVGVIGEHDRVHIVAQKFIVIGVIGDAVAVLCPHFVEPLRPLVADGDELGVAGVFAVGDEVRAAPRADDAEADLVRAFAHEGSSLS